MSRPVDLVRARAAEEQLGALARQHPDLTDPETVERLAAALPALLQEEDSMNPEVLNLRVPGGTKARAEALIPVAARLPEVRKASEAASAIGSRLPRMTPSQVLRLALFRGLEQLEAELSEEQDQ